MSEETRTVPISGRIPEEDYVYLMENMGNGTVTASEKLRQVVHFYHRYHKGLQSYPQAVAEVSRMLESYRLSAKAAENLEGMRSDLMDKLLTTLPEVLATMTSANIPQQTGSARKRLLETEERASQLILNLVESLLRYGMTRHSPTYNPKLLHERLGSIFEILELVQKNSLLNQPKEERS